MAAVAIAGGRVELNGMGGRLPQGDSAITGFLTSLGAEITDSGDSITVKADGEDLKGGTFALQDTPDLLPVLAVLGLRCSDPMEITGASHARFKETDRITVLAEELRKMGGNVDERSDGLKISKPKAVRSAILDARGDHRMFMAFALASFLSPGEIRVEGEESLDVSYPQFLDDLATLGAKVHRN